MVSCENGFAAEVFDITMSDEGTECNGLGERSRSTVC